METKIIVNSLRACDKPCTVLLDVTAGMIADRLEEQETEIAELKKQPSEQQDRWISVDDRLPEEKQELFMCFMEMERKFFLVLRGFYANSEWYVYTGVNLYTQCDDIPSFWAPDSIIEPPKPKVPTFYEKFLEAFPNNRFKKDETPNICRNDVFGYMGCCPMQHAQNYVDCEACWNEPYHEHEKEGENNE